jgi:hypothetical protein
MAKSAVALLARDARAALGAINTDLSALVAKRAARLLAGDDAAAIGAIDVEIEQRQRSAKVEADRIELLRRKAAEEEEQTVAKRRAGLVERFAKKLAAADEVADEFQATLAKAEAQFREIIALREEARRFWPIADAHFNALAGATDGAALSAHAVHALVRYEIHRIGSRPFLGGSPGAVGEVSFPGGIPPNLTLQLQPGKITPLGEALRAASAAAVAAMREGKVDPLAAIAPVAPAGDGETTATQLSRLWAEQARLATDVSEEGEARYAEIVREIARLQGAADAPKTGDDPALRGTEVAA